MKKTIAILSVLVLLSVACALAASSVSLPSSVAITASGRNVTTTQTFTVKNNGNTTLSGITITSDADSKYNVQFSNVPSALNASASKSVTIKVYAPVDEAISEHNIGNIIFSSNSVTNSTPLKLNIKSKLEIDEVKIKIAGSSKTIGSDGEKFDDTDNLLGSTYSVEIKVCNLFSDNDDKIENIEIKAVFEGIDNDDDIEGEVKEFDLDGDECTSSFKTIVMDKNRIPLLADEDTYDLVITANGEDEHGDDYEDEWTIPVKVYREDDPLMLFETAEVIPSQVTCSRQVTINAEAYNIGDDDDEGVLTIKNAELGIDITKYFEFGKDPTEDCDAIEDPEDGCIGFDKSFNVDLPSNLASKTYPIDFKTYYSTDSLMEQKTVNLEVKPCSTQPAASTTTTSTTNTSQTPVVVVTKPSTTSTSSSAGSPAVIVKKEGTNSLYIAILVTLNLAIIAIIIYLLTLFVI